MSLRSVETRSLASSLAMSRFATLTGAPARFQGGLHELARRTWAWLQPNGGLGESNAGLIAGEGGPAEASPRARARLLVRTIALGQELAAARG
jgi:hypothetical protein